MSHKNAFKLKLKFRIFAIQHRIDIVLNEPKEEEGGKKHSIIEQWNDTWPQMPVKANRFSYRAMVW